MVLLESKSLMLVATMPLTPVWPCAYGMAPQRRSQQDISTVMMKPPLKVYNNAADVFHYFGNTIYSN